MVKLNFTYFLSSTLLNFMIFKDFYVLTIFIFLMFFLSKELYSFERSPIIYTLNLKEAIAIALEKNKRLLSFKEKINIAFYQVKESSSRLYPQLDLRGGLSYAKFFDKRNYKSEIPQNQEKFPQIFEEPYTTSLSIHLSQLLFDDKKTTTAIKRAQENLKEVEIEYELLKHEVIVQVGEAYYNLVKTRKKKKVYQEEKEKAQYLYDITCTKLKQGLIAELDQKKARLNLLETEGKVNTAKSIEEIAQEQLKRLLGLPVDSLINIDEHLPQFKPIEFQMDEVISKALDNSLEIKRAQINLNKEKFSKKMAKALYWPQLTLQANYTWQGANKNFKQTFKKFQDHYWGVSLNLMMAIFDGGYIKSQLKQAEAAVNQAKIELEKIKESVIFDIREKVIKLKESQDRITRQQENVVLWRENVEVITAKWEEGLATINEVFEANKTLTEVFVNYIDALCDYELDKIKFYIGIGEINAFL